MRKQGLLFITIVLLCLQVSCTVEKECRTEYTACLNVVLEADSVTRGGETIRMARLDSVSVQGVGRDTLWMNNQKNVERLGLPLRVDTTCTEYVCTFNSTEEYLRIYHTNNPHFVSLACGCFMYYTIDSIACDGYAIDSIEVLNAQIENVSQDNVRLHIVLKP